MLWELEKAIFGPEKDKWWIWGSKTRKPPEMPIKLGKTSQHHNWPRYMDWPQIGPKNYFKTGEKTPKGHMVSISRGPPPPPKKRDAIQQERSLQVAVLGTIVTSAQETCRGLVSHYSAIGDTISWRRPL